MTARVCVTGAAGYVGSHVVRELLERGYQVRATLRDAGDANKAGVVRGLVADSADRLELVSADLLTPGAFDEAVSGCDYILHVASSVMLTADDPQRQIVDVAVAGTRNVLTSIRRAQESGTAVKGVGITSSIAAVSANRARPGHVYDESDWCEDATLATSPYALSKTLAERAAWDFHEALPEDQRWPLVVVNPVLVLGPVYSKVHLRSSPAVVGDILRRSFPANPPLSFGIVDVRDVASALVNGVTRPAPTGRYILHAESCWMRDLAGMLARQYPQRGIRTGRLPGPLMYVAALFDKRLSFHFVRANLGRRDSYNNARMLAELGVKPRPVEQTVLDTARSILELTG